LLLCSPQNPTGKVWTRDELTQMAELCERYDVAVISDEIHMDMVWGESSHAVDRSGAEQMGASDLRLEKL
jgi:cystathionine beta-lyase